MLFLQINFDDKLLLTLNSAPMSLNEPGYFLMEQNVQYLGCTERKTLMFITSQMYLIWKIFWVFP